MTAHEEQDERVVFFRPSLDASARGFSLLQGRLVSRRRRADSLRMWSAIAGGRPA